MWRLTKSAALSSPLRSSIQGGDTRHFKTPDGRDVVAGFCACLFGAGRRTELVPTRANGQPAFGTYLRAPGGISHGTGLYVLTLIGDRICAMTRTPCSHRSGYRARSQADSQHLNRHRPARL